MFNKQPCSPGSRNLNTIPHVAQILQQKGSFPEARAAPRLAIADVCWLPENTSDKRYNLTDSALHHQFEHDSYGDE